MKYIKMSLMAVLILLSVLSIAQEKTYSPWDKLWFEVSSSLVHINRNLSGKDKFLAEQAAILKYRKEGLILWKSFPNGPDRFHWLSRAVYYGWQFYYLNAKEVNEEYKKTINGESYDLQLDTNSLLEWERIYPKLKSEYLEYCERNRDFRTGAVLRPELNLLLNELRSFLTLSLNKKYRNSEKIDLNKVRILFLSAGKYLNHEKVDRPTWAQVDVLSCMNSCFFEKYEKLGLNLTDVKAFLNSLNSNPIPVIRNWAINKTTFLTLMDSPLTLKHASINGDVIDLGKMRGKVVLIDFWSTSCSGCIERMPAIKEVYDKYKYQGFEVISACLNSEEETEQVKEIEAKIGADWPILMLGGRTKEDKPQSLGREIWRKYSFFGVPQLLLLDKQGKLVMINGKLQNGDFEPIVKGLLEKEYRLN